MAKGIQNPAIPLGSLVAVTGVNGFIGAHAADQLLAAGYKVRGTTRDATKNSWLKEQFDSNYGPDRFELFEVKDMSKESAFDDAAKGCSGFIHVASNMSFSNDPNAVIPEVIDGALNAVKSASKEPSIKRFVYTSSSTAALLPKLNERFPVTQETWNDETVEKAWKPNADPFSVYGASKTEAERAIWKWVDENKPSFVVNTVLPNANFGPPTSFKHQGHPSTSKWITDLFNSNYDAIKGNSPQWFVDVRDDAQIHVIALVHPKVENERLFAFAAPFDFDGLIEALRKNYPDRKWEDYGDVGKDLSDVIPSKRAEELLKEAYGHGWISLEESLRDNTKDLVN